mmetsp:Transcript_6601/g.15679  ORF Transcript_6601/g.15679 Transcript_6601/m.15679 type:complete len:341 (-) Transcript_6601:1335-2357(-)
MVHHVFHQVLVQGLAFGVVVVEEACELLFVLLVLSKERQGLVESPVGLSKDVEHMREQLPDAQLWWNPVPCTVKGHHPQLFSQCVTHQGTELFHFVHRIPGPNRQAVTSSVRHRSALYLELIVPDVTVTVNRGQWLVRQQRQPCCGRWDDVLVLYGWLLHLARRHVDAVAWCGDLSRQWLLRSPQRRPQLWQPSVPTRVVAVLIAVVADTAGQQAPAAQLAQPRVVASCCDAELAVGGVAKAENAELCAAQPRHGQVCGLQAQPGPLAVLREVTQAASRHDKHKNLLVRELLELKVIQSAHLGLQAPGEDILEEVLCLLLSIAGLAAIEDGDGISCIASC